MTGLSLIWGSLFLGSVLTGHIQVSPALSNQIAVSQELLHSVEAADVRLNPLKQSEYRIAQAVEGPVQIPPKPSLSAFRALTQLIEHHDCSSYSNPSESVLNISRFKVAALLFNCLENWNEQAFASHDQAALETLRSEFKLELVALQGSNVSEPLLLGSSFDQSTSPAFSANYFGPDAFAYRSATQGSATGFSRSMTGKVQGRVSVDMNAANPAASGDTVSDINAEASLGNISLFDHYSTSLVDQSGVITLPVDRGSQVWTVGVGLRSFIIPNSMLGVSASKASSSATSAPPTQMSYGAFYQFPLTKRLTILPSIVIMPHATSSGPDPDVQGALRASFSF